MIKSALPDIFADDILSEGETVDAPAGEQQSDDKAASKQASLIVKTLEPRILLSATWVDTDPDEEVAEEPIADEDIADGRPDPAYDLFADDEDLFLPIEDDDLLPEDPEGDPLVVETNVAPLDVVLIDSTLDQM